jgi:hypothetical protein
MLAPMRHSEYGPAFRPVNRLAPPAKRMQAGFARLQG